MSDNQLRPLQNRCAWVTGASRGIGRAIALTLASAGARVVLGARSVDQLDQVVESIRANGGIAHGVELDVSLLESCEAFATKAREFEGNPDILINNAGVGIFRPIDGFQPDEFEQQFRVNVFGTFYMTKLVIPAMKDNGFGHVINISSLAGENDGYMGTGYFASKHAVHGFTKSLFQDVRKFGIKVTLVCPGSVDTRFHYDSHPGSHLKDQSWMVMPQDVADSVLHVLSLPKQALVSKIDVRPTVLPQKT